jgi:hypothetical protein
MTGGAAKCDLRDLRTTKYRIQLSKPINASEQGGNDGEKTAS